MNLNVEDVIKDPFNLEQFKDWYVGAFFEVDQKAYVKTGQDTVAGYFYDAEQKRQVEFEEIKKTLNMLIASIEKLHKDIEEIKSKYD